MRFITKSEKETMDIGRSLARVLKKGDVVLLEGALGAGKTVFVKGAMEEMGFEKDAVRSPTFTLVREYKRGNLVVSHMDLYRVEQAEELVQMGYEDYFYSPQGITFIEWSEKVEGLISAYIKVTLEYRGLEQRDIRIGTKNRSEIIFENNENFRD